MLIAINWREVPVISYYPAVHKKGIGLVLL